MRYPETGQDLGLALERRAQNSKPIFPHGLISVNKSTLLLDRATAMEDCLRGPKDWMIDGIDFLTLVPAVVMEAALIMAVRLMVPRIMSEVDLTSVLVIVIVTSPCGLPLTISCVVLPVILELAERMAGLWIDRVVCVDLDLDPDLGPMTPSMVVMALCEES